MKEAGDRKKKDLLRRPHASSFFRAKTEIICARTESICVPASCSSSINRTLYHHQLHCSETEQHNIQSQATSIYTDRKYTCPAKQRSIDRSRWPASRSACRSRSSWPWAACRPAARPWACPSRRRTSTSPSPSRASSGARAAGTPATSAPWTRRRSPVRTYIAAAV